jgi:hypothetical protein
MDEPLRSIEVDVERAANGQVRRARIRFGPHHVVEVRTDGEKTSFALRYTHHGFGSTRPKSAASSNGSSTKYAALILVRRSTEMRRRVPRGVPTQSAGTRAEPASNGLTRNR